MERKTHFFYALKLPTTIKLQLKEICDRLKRELLFRRWVHDEDYHITLAFLGGADEEQLQASQDYVKEALQGVSPFLLSVNHLGIFGKQDSPRILWAGVEEAEQLNKVRDLTFHACTKAGFKLEKRPFRPHITLARKWSGPVLFPEDFLEKENPFLDHKLSFYANEIVLYETHLDKIPKYEVKQSFLLHDEGK